MSITQPFYGDGFQAFRFVTADGSLESQVCRIMQWRVPDVLRPDLRRAGLAA